MIQHQFVVRGAPDIKSLTPWFEDQRYLAAAILLSHACDNFDVRHWWRRYWNRHTGLFRTLRFIFFPQVFFKVAEIWIDGNTGSKDIDFGFDR